MSDLDSCIAANPAAVTEKLQMWTILACPFSNETRDEDASVPFDQVCDSSEKVAQLPRYITQESPCDPSVLYFCSPDVLCSPQAASPRLGAAQRQIPHSQSLFSIGEPHLEQPILEPRHAYEQQVGAGDQGSSGDDSDTRSPLEGFLSSFSYFRQSLPKREFRRPEFLSKLSLFRSNAGQKTIDPPSGESEECSTEASTGRTIAAVEPEPCSRSDARRRSSTPILIPRLAFPFAHRLPRHFGTPDQRQDTTDTAVQHSQALAYRSAILTAQDFLEFALRQSSLDDFVRMAESTDLSDNVVPDSHFIPSSPDNGTDPQTGRCWARTTGKCLLQSCDVRVRQRNVGLAVPEPAVRRSALGLSPVILIPGGGIFYFWKAGFTLYLTQHFDLSSCIFFGTSAGALAGVLACVNPDRITWASRLAIQLAMKRQVFEKSYFLAGSLHNIAREWLLKIIPDDFSFDSLKWRLVIVALRVSRVRLEGLSDFASKVDLMECLLASIHIPFYANGKPYVKARGSNYLDGSFGGDLRLYMEGIPSENIVTIKCSASDYVTPIAKRECIRKLPAARLLGLLREGFEYAKFLHDTGGLPAIAHLERRAPGSFSLDGDPFLDPDKIMDETLN